jgi:hypothetical protein
MPSPKLRDCIEEALDREDFATRMRPTFEALNLRPLLNADSDVVRGSVGYQRLDHVRPSEAPGGTAEHVANSTEALGSKCLPEDAPVCRSGVAQILGHHARWL